MRCVAPRGMKTRTKDDGRKTNDRGARGHNRERVISGGPSSVVGGPFFQGSSPCPGTRITTKIGATDRHSQLAPRNSLYFHTRPATPVEAPPGGHAAFPSPPGGVSRPRSGWTRDRRRSVVSGRWSIFQGQAPTIQRPRSVESPPGRPDAWRQSRRRSRPTGRRRRRVHPGASAGP